MEPIARPFSTVALLLMRHGQIVQEPPAPDGGRRLVGDRDLPLDARGRQQARAAGHTLAGLGLCRAWSSDLSRSVETLTLATAGLASGPALRREPALREICVGAWQGLSPRETEALTPGGWAARGADLAGYRPPGGESYREVQERSWRALSALAEAARQAGEGAALAVAHAGVNRAVLCRAMGLPLSAVLSLPQDYGCLNLLLWDGAHFAARAVNLLPQALAPGWAAAYLPGLAAAARA